MLFAATCLDRPDSFGLRDALRPDHLAFLGGLGARVKIAGPFLDAQGRMTGTLIVVEAPDEASARAALARDPYAQGGLFASVDVRAWRWVVGEPK